MLAPKIDAADAARALETTIRQLARENTVSQIARALGLRPGEISAICLAKGIPVGGAADEAAWPRFGALPLIIPWFDGAAGKAILREAARRNMLPEALATRCLEVVAQDKLFGALLDR